MIYRIIGFATDGKAVIEEMTTGEIVKVEAPLFRDGEVVSTTEKHFSQKELTRLLHPMYADRRGWVYTENYISEDGESGGCGSAFNEDLFRKPVALETKLKAKRIELIKSQESLKGKGNAIEKELSIIEYALSI